MAILSLPRFGALRNHAVCFVCVKQAFLLDTVATLGAQHTSQTEAHAKEIDRLKADAVEVRK